MHDVLNNFPDNCDTLMLDMDGTLLDLAFDNFVWLHVVPCEYALRQSMTEEQARDQLHTTMRRLQGKLDWYCLDHWSELLDLDIAALHRDVNHRIGYLPGAEEFLEHVAAADIRVLLVSNSHQVTLEIKDEVTDVKRFFDEIYLSHDLGHPKEDQPFWESLQAREGFDPARSVFVDDNIRVLDSARQYGIQNLVAVARPEVSGPAREMTGYRSVDRVSELINSQD